MQKYYLLFCILLNCRSLCQVRELRERSLQVSEISSSHENVLLTIQKFRATAEFMDVAVSSYNAFYSLIQKENYRSRLISLNNPASSELGFNLQTEIQSALKPILLKLKNTSPSRFSEVVSGLVSAQHKMTIANTILNSVNPVFGSLVSLVGSLAIKEKSISKDDLDSFISTTSKFFHQYERLNQTNLEFDRQIEDLNQRMKNLQFDIRTYLIDLIEIINKNNVRLQIKNETTEELLLKYFNPDKLKSQFFSDSLSIVYPSDGIKSSKEIAYTIQKLFEAYQKIYSENYRQVRTILTDSKLLGRQINVKQLDASLAEIDRLFSESRSSDLLGLRIATLNDRLRLLVNTEQHFKAF